MKDTQIAQGKRGIPKDAHKKADRHNAIRALLTSEKRSKKVANLDLMVKYLMDDNNIKVTASTLSKDKKEVGFDKATEGNETYYVLTEAGKRDGYIHDLCSMFTQAGIKPSDYIEPKSTGMFVMKTYGHSHAIAGRLKKVFSHSIIDVICLEHTLVIFYDKTVKENGTDTIRDELKWILSKMNTAR